MRIPVQWRRTWQKTPEAHQLPFPATPHLRTALLGDGACFGELVAFPQARWRDLPAFDPQVLVGAAAVLLKAADLTFSGQLPLNTLDSAVFVLTQTGGRPLAETERNLLWRAFLVPVFELLVDRNGKLLAAECEAHDGWHLADLSLEILPEEEELLFQRRGVPGTEIATGLSAERPIAVCSCGNQAPLLRNIRLAKAPARLLAATA